MPRFAPICTTTTPHPPRPGRGGVHRPHRLCTAAPRRGTERHGSAPRFTTAPGAPGRPRGAAPPGRARNDTGCRVTSRGGRGQTLADAPRATGINPSASTRTWARLGAEGGDVLRVLRREPRHRRRRCGARCRDGHPCAAPVASYRDGDGRLCVARRCRCHGGLSTGPRTAEGRARSLAALARGRATQTARRCSP